MKKIILLLIILLTCTSCKDYVEINDFAIISGIIIDYKDNKFEMISELLINEENTKVKTFQTSGKSIDECLSEISKQSNKDIFISHLKTLILTENIIKNDIDIYDYFLRSSKSKMNFDIYLIDEKNKTEIFNIYENEPTSQYIKKIMTYNNKIYSSSTPLTFIDLVYKRLEPGLDILYPYLTIKENNEEKNIQLDNLTFFTKDKITLSTNNYNMLINNIEKTILNLNCEENQYSLLTKDIKTNKEWNKSKKELTYNVNIKASINNYECKYDLDEPKTIKKLNEISNKEVEKNIVELIQISKNNNYDFLGIRNYIYKHDKNNFKKYKLENIKTKINVNVEINSIGEMRR